MKKTSPSSSKSSIDTDSSTERWLEFGTLGRPHGVRGDLRLHLDHVGDELPGDVETLQVTPGPSQQTGLNPPRSAIVEVLSLRRVHQGFLVRFAGYASPEAARTLVGCRVAIAQSMLPELDGDDAFLQEYVGAMAWDAATATALGLIEGLDDNGAQVLLVIRDAQGRQRLLPCVAAFSPTLQRGAQRLSLMLPEGLWESLV